MKPESLQQNIRKQALGWTISGIILTLFLTGALALVLMFKDTERQIDTLATSALASERTELLSGDVRSTELRLKKDFGLRSDEKLLFLDEARKPWVGGLSETSLITCVSRTPCRNWFQQKIVLERPIFFDEDGKQLWGYLHIEKNADANWSLIFGVALSVIAGMLLQGIGVYFNIVKSIRAASAVLENWAKKISENPKEQAEYQNVPFSEIADAGKALYGLKEQIETLEREAREQGALVTLRGIGHDILNPVARMKRILGLLEIEGQSSPQNLQSLRANLKRLSSYAEQLKLIYKQHIGEPSTIPITDLSKEVRELASELLSDPEAVEKRIKLEVETETGCSSRIPAPAFSRIVENLCSNGIHASPEGSTVSLRVESKGDRVSILVRDAGAGIPVANRPNIFKPDFTTKGNKGTGLGLYVVKHVCELYGGRVDFSSNANGTDFLLEFPRVEVGL